MKSDELQMLEHNLTMTDDVLFRKRGRRGPMPGYSGTQIRNHVWRTNGFTGRGKADERLTVTEDGFEWRDRQ